MSELHYDGPDLKIKKFVVGPYDNNCYVVADPVTNVGVLVDTPAEPERILAEARGTDIRYILLTHSHFDHIQAWDAVRHALPNARAGAHRDDASGLSSPPDFLLEEGQKLAFGERSLTALCTPGHTPGGVCFLSGAHLFSGDTLFPNGPGRTASNAALRQLLTSVVQRLFTLPDTTCVYPGHGDDAVIGVEKAKYAAFDARPHDADLHGDVLWIES